MRLSERIIDELAAELLERELARRPGPALTQIRPDLSAEDAYEIQRAVIARRRAETGARIVGHKIGATSRAVQDMFGVRTPDFGHLLDDMVLEDRAVVDPGSLIAPKIEPEIAFLLGSPLRGPGVTIAEVIAATVAVAPALEIIDTRIANWAITFPDTVADNGSSARVVLGERFAAPTSLDLRTLGVVLEIDGIVHGTGAGAASLGHPARAVAWLANALAAAGTGLDAGHLVLSGALTSPPAVLPGARVTAEFAQLGTVACRFDRSHP